MFQVYKQTKELFIKSFIHYMAGAESPQGGRNELTPEQKAEEIAEEKDLLKKMEKDGILDGSDLKNLKAILDDEEGVMDKTKAILVEIFRENSISQFTIMNKNDLEVFEKLYLLVFQKKSGLSWEGNQIEVTKVEDNGDIILSSDEKATEDTTEVIPDTSKTQAVPDTSKTQAVPDTSKTKVVPDTSKTKVVPDSTKKTTESKATEETTEETIEKAIESFKLHYNNGEYQKAIDALNKVDIERLGEENIVYLAHCYSKVNEREEAIKVCNDGLKVYKDNPSILNYKGALLLDSGRIKEALDIFVELNKKIDSINNESLRNNIIKNLNAAEEAKEAEDTEKAKEAEDTEKAKEATLNLNNSINIKHAWVKKQIRTYKEINTSFDYTKPTLDDIKGILEKYKNADFSKKDDTPKNSALIIYALQVAISHFQNNNKLGDIDGIYGNKTKGDLEKLQEHLGFGKKVEGKPSHEKVIDGIPGPITIGAIIDRLNS